MKIRTISKALLLIVLLAFCLPAQTQRTVSITASITNGTAVTGAIALGSCFPIGIITPPAWTAASLMLTASLDGTTFYTVYDIYGSKAIITADVDRWIVLNPPETWSFRYLKIRSTNASGVDVNQGGTRTLKVVCR